MASILEQMDGLQTSDMLTIYYFAFLSCNNLVHMIEMLTVELERKRLLLNATNTKVSTTCGTNDACHVEVMGSMLEVLHGTATHKYLGRLLVGQLKRRSEDEISHRLQVAWAKFHKYNISMC
jgi:hypothetical protein